MAGNMAENTAGLYAGDAVGFAGQNRPQSPAQTSSFSPARTSPSMSSSPIRANVTPSLDRRSRPTFRWNCTRQCPFSFDLRDSRRRVAREQELEYLKLMAESRLAVDFTFRANPVRRYKPLILEQSTRPLTIPKSPFSSRYTRK